MDFLGSAIAQVFEAFVSHGEAVQSIACFLLSLVFAIALVIQSLRSSKSHSTDMKETSQALNRISETMAKLNTRLITAVNSIELELEKHHEIIVETLIRPKISGIPVDLKLFKERFDPEPEKKDHRRYSFDFTPLPLPPSEEDEEGYVEERDSNKTEKKRRPFRKADE